MKKQKVWGIIGAGWLGQEIMNRLAQLGIEHWGTTRKIFDWKLDDFPEKECDVLLLNTPPLTEILPEDFVKKIPVRDRQRIIFISSIGVYGSLPGEVSERTPPQPVTKNGLWLVAVENLLLEKFSGNICIVRAGGLIGGNRHPVFYLSNKSIANAPINLIHRNDLIEIIFAISELEKVPFIINAVAPSHPSKKDYYNAWVQKLNLAPVHVLDKQDDSRVVMSEFLPSIYPKWICPDLDNL